MKNSEPSPSFYDIVHELVRPSLDLEGLASMAALLIQHLTGGIGQLEAVLRDLKVIEENLASTALLHRLALGLADAADSLWRRSEHLADPEPSSPQDAAQLLQDHLVVLAQLLQLVQLKRVPSVGQAFDPSLHQAVGREDTDDPERHRLVTEEIRPGYRRASWLLRPAEVIVAIHQTRKENPNA